MTSERRDQLKVLVGRLALVAVCIALWEVATRTVIDPFFVSSPSRIAGSLFGEITDLGFYRDLYVSGIEMLLGFGLGFARRNHNGSFVGAMGNRRENY